MASGVRSGARMRGKAPSERFWSEPDAVVEAALRVTARSALAGPIDDALEAIADDVAAGWQEDPLATTLDDAS